MLADTEHMGWMQRIFMDSHQKKLVDPSAYRQPLDRAQVLAEVDAGASGVRCHETLPSLRRAIKETNEGGALTIAHVADAYESTLRTVRAPHDGCYHEFLTIALAGDSALLNFLTQRANQIAQGIQPGAKAALGSAFDAK